MIFDASRIWKGVQLTSVRNVVGIGSSSSAAAAPGPGANSSFVLAAEKTHRKDPLDGLRYYSGGWNISDEHYWAVSPYSSSFRIRSRSAILVLIDFVADFRGAIFHSAVGRLHRGAGVRGGGGLVRPLRNCPLPRRLLLLLLPGRRRRRLLLARVPRRLAPAPPRRHGRRRVSNPPNPRCSLPLQLDHRRRSSILTGRSRVSSSTAASGAPCCTTGRAGSTAARRRRWTTWCGSPATRWPTCVASRASSRPPRPPAWGPSRCPPT